MTESWLAAHLSPQAYMAVLFVAMCVLFATALALFWYVSKRAPPGTLLAIGALTYLVGGALAGSLVLETKLLCGIFRLLGLAGIVWGVVELVRRRGKKHDQDE